MLPQLFGVQPRPHCCCRGCAGLEHHLSCQHPVLDPGGRSSKSTILLLRSQVLEDSGQDQGVGGICFPDLGQKESASPAGTVQGRLCSHWPCSASLHSWQDAAQGQGGGRSHQTRQGPGGGEGYVLGTEALGVSRVGHSPSPACPVPRDAVICSAPELSEGSHFRSASSAVERGLGQTWLE